MGMMTTGLVIKLPNRFPVYAAESPSKAKVLAIPIVYAAASKKLRDSELLP